VQGAGGNFLARPGFPGYQDGGAAGTHHADHVANVTDLRAGSHQLVLPTFRIDDFGQPEEPLAGPVVENGLNPGEGTLVAGRQDEEPRAAELGGLRGVLDAPEKDRRISRK
jgi:hypothetical protein